MEQSITFPPIRELKISHPSLVDNEEEYMAAIVELARSQHALGVPFGRVTVRGEHFPTATTEMLGPWVGEVDYRKKPYTRAYNEWNRTLYGTGATLAGYRSTGLVMCRDKFHQILRQLQKDQSKIVNKEGSARI